MTAQGALQEHGTTLLFPWTTQIVGSIGHTLFCHHIATTEEQTCIERADTEFGMQGTGKCQSTVSSSSDISTTFDTANLTVVKPFQSTIVDKIGGTYDGTVGKISTRTDICLVGIVISAEHTVIEQVGITRSEESLGLSHITCSVSYSEVLCIEASGVDVQCSTVIIGVRRIVATTIYRRGEDGCFLVLSHQTDVFVVAALGAAVDILVIHSRTDIDNASRTIGHCIDRLLHLGVVEIGRAHV